MPTPKSITKITKEGVVFTSDVDKSQYYLFELTRAAMRDVGKFVRAEFKKRFYEQFKKHTGNAAKQLSAKVWSSQNTLYPRVEVGIKSGGIKGYSMQQEFGTSKTKKLGLLTKSVEENIRTILEIESKYLDYINLDDMAIEQHINENEEEVEDEI